MYSGYFTLLFKAKVNLIQLTNWFNFYTVFVMKILLRLIHNLRILIQGSIFVCLTSAYHVPTLAKLSKLRQNMIDASQDLAFGSRQLKQDNSEWSSQCAKGKKKINIQSAWIFNILFIWKQPFFPSCFLFLCLFCFSFFRSSKAQDKLAS